VQGADIIFIQIGLTATVDKTLGPEALVTSRSGERTVNSEPAGSSERETVVPLELFFDLVFVFAFTQVTTLLVHDPSWGGVLRAALLLSVLWWAWSAYAWLTNTVDPEEGGVRIAMFAAAAAMLVTSLAAPHAFGRDGFVFGIAYVVVRVLHLVLYALAGRGDPELFGAVLRIVPPVLVSGAVLLVASQLDMTPKLWCWAAAAAIDYLGPLIGHMRGWRLSPSHFVERFSLVILIALGESVVAIGVGASGLELTVGLIAAVLVGMVIIACVWWSYFDWVIFVARVRLEEASGTRRAALARDAYSYLHFPMVAGIVLFAFGLETALHDTSSKLDTVPAFGLTCGIALYLFAHVAMRLRIGGGLGRGRPVAAVVLLMLFPVNTETPAAAAVASVAAVSVALIAYEVLRHRADRAAIRARRGSLTAQDLAGFDHDQSRG
jgi:low temperature requirement protein LtrA